MTRFPARSAASAFRRHRAPDLIAALCLLSALALPGIAAAQAPTTAGKWVGVYERAGGRLVPVILDLVPPQAGQAGGTLTYGEPDRCSLPLTVVGTSETDTTFTLGLSNGGRCQAYAEGRLQVTRNDPEPGVDFVLTPQNGTPILGNAVPAAAAPTTQAIAGSWTGSYQARTGDVPMTLTVTPVGVADPAGQLTFGAPDQCQVALEFTWSPMPGTYVFTPAAANGGRCQAYVLGTLTLTEGEPNRLTAVMNDPRGERRFETSLAR